MIYNLSFTIIGEPSNGTKTPIWFNDLGQKVEVTKSAV